jgi:hypothetical protein
MILVCAINLYFSKQRVSDENPTEADDTQVST